ncbi:MAG TPA: thioesterase family protein [Myxococcales bacterium]|nr:thioesterase family protein [Myxococcales bacterium]
MTRDDFPHFLRIETRWMDNDVYGHVNNATYYSFFDTAVNKHLLDAKVLDLEGSPAFGVVVETGCKYMKSIAFPDVIHAGMRVTKLGNSSVRYELALFRNDEPDASAEGWFVHVYVDRAMRRPVRIPDEVRAALAPLRR